MSVIFENVDKIVNASGVGIDFAQGVGGGSSKEFVATGNIGQGQTVGLKADGTVEVIQETVTTTTQTEDLGAPVVFENAHALYISAIFAPSINKVIVVYTDAGNNWYGTIVLGTISGNSINFETPVVFKSGNTERASVAFYPAEHRVIIAYYDGSNAGYGTCIVGEVIGNSISFGFNRVFNSGITNSISNTYIPDSDKVVIAYRDVTSGDYGKAIVGTVDGNQIYFNSASVDLGVGRVSTVTSAFNSHSNKLMIINQDYNGNGGQIVLGTISGESISFGSPVRFANRSLQAMDIDSSLNKVVIAYRDQSNNSYGTAITGTISGNSISFGNAVVFCSSPTYYVCVTFEPVFNKVLILHQSHNDTFGKDLGYGIVGEVSGDSISFESPFVFKNSALSYMSICFDSTSNKAVLAYRDNADLNKGKAIAITPGITSTTKSYNASSWLGIADEAITSGDSGKINLIGSVDSHQTGLTTGNTYYVNYDGTLTDTPNEGVKNGTYGKIGKALSSTSLLLSK